MVGRGEKRRESSRSVLNANYASERVTSTGSIRLREEPVCVSGCTKGMTPLFAPPELTARPGQSPAVEWDDGPEVTTKARKA